MGFLFLRLFLAGRKEIVAFDLPSLYYLPKIDEVRVNITGM